jgi:hypothetical protein
MRRTAVTLAIRVFSRFVGVKATLLYRWSAAFSGAVHRFEARDRNPAPYVFLASLLRRKRCRLLTLTTDASRRNVLDVDANAVPA